jgi:hypothetical protein
LIVIRPSHPAQRGAAVALAVIAAVLGVSYGSGVAHAQTKQVTAASVVSAIERTYAVCAEKTSNAGSDGSRSTTMLGINDCSVPSNSIVVKTFKSGSAAEKAGLKAPVADVWILGNIAAYSKMARAPRLDALLQKLGAYDVLGSPPTTIPASTTTTAPPPAIVSTLMAGTAHPTVAPGTKGSLDVTYVAAPIDQSYGAGTILPVIVWNGTGKSVSHVDVSGPAKDASGTVLGSGDSQEIEPQTLAPNEVAFGLVFFTQSIPPGSAFDLTATASSGSSTYFLDAQVTQANYVPGQYGENSVTGEVVNSQQISMRGPISASVFCFSDAGVLTDVFSGFVSGNAGLEPGQTGGFSTSIYRQTECPTFLVGASGFGSY